MPKTTAKKHSDLRVVRVIVLVAAVLSLLILLARPWIAEPVPPRQAWLKSVELGVQSGIDPLLIFAIACAESSLDGHASNARARGLMQITPTAWESVTKHPFREAWQWQRNMEEAVSYLKQIKEKQQKDGHYSWPSLAAAYRYGPGALQSVGYDLSRLPKSSNIIYMDLIAGKTPKLPSPAPARQIEALWPPPPAAQPEPQTPPQEMASPQPEPADETPVAEPQSEDPTNLVSPPALTENQVMLQ